MATLYGVNATLRDVNVPAEKIETKMDFGRLRVSYDEITLAAELTAADVIKCMKLPKGAKMYDAHLQSPQLGSAGGSGELDFGFEANGSDAADPNAFLSAVEVGSAAANVRMSDDLTLAGNSFEFAEETQLIITANETTDAGIGDKIKVWVYYSLD